jgi:integrase
MRRWLAEGEVRDARGQHVNVTAHQFRHTLATRMINNEVPPRSSGGCWTTARQR